MLLLSRTCPAFVLSSFLIAIGFHATAAKAEIPERMHYQGYLTLTNGDLVECADPATCSQPVDLTFRIYSDPVADALLWEEDHLSVIVIGGMFHVTLGADAPITPDLLGGPAFLGVEVNGNEELEPRQELVSAGRAMHCTQALNATKLGGVDAENYMTDDAGESLQEQITSSQNQIAVLEEKLLALEEAVAQGGSSGGGGDESNAPLINEVHTAGECIEAGGIVTDIPGGEKVCRFTGSSCGSGWTQLETWCTTSFLFCSGKSPNSCGPAQTCTVQGHPFANEAPGSCSVPNFCEDIYLDCLGNWGCGTTTCTSEVTEMGCF